MPLEWVEAEGKHAARLEGFVCTDPPRRTWNPLLGRKEHKREWELNVQSAIRSQLSPPRRPPEYLFLGLIGGEIKAVLFFTVVQSTKTVMVHIVARAFALHGVRVGQEIMDKLLAVVDELAPDMQIVSRIHIRNKSSEALFSRFGFLPETEKNEHGLRLWSRPAGIDHNATDQPMRDVSHH